MNYSLKTHQGKRKNNQDYAGVFINKAGLLLAVLCDGLGGHRGGDTASEMAVSQIGNSWKKTSFTADEAELVQDWLDENINRENERIYEYANKYPDLDGMGTTLVAGVILAEEILFSNVGDSRAYTYGDGKLELITEDHSFVSELQRQGELTALEAKNHYNRNALTRSLGVKSKVNVDFFKSLKSSVELIMLNSDGLSNIVEEVDIIDVLKAKDLSLNQKSGKLVQLAVDNEGTDNITVALIDLMGHDDFKEKKFGEKE